MSYAWTINKDNQGIYELNDNIRIKIDYLKDACSDFSLENYWIISAVASLSIEEIKERYEKYSQVLKTEQITSNTLALPLQKFDNYKKHFSELGFDDIQLDQGIKAIVNLGGIAKDCNRINEAIEAINSLGMSKDERNQFICDNADLIYNDYSRKIPEIIGNIINKFGSADAFIQLKEHPEWMRYGIE